MPNQDYKGLTDTHSRKLLMLLDSLRESDAGTLLYQQAKHFLQASAKENLEQQQAYAQLLGLLLDNLASGLTADSQLRLSIKLLQVRLQPPLTSSEHEAISASLQELNDQLAKGAGRSEDSLRQTLVPLLESFGLSQPAAKQSTVPNKQESMHSTAEDTRVIKDYSPPPAFEKNQTQKVNSVYRNHLTEKQKNLQQLETDLLNKIRSIQKCHNTFSTLLGKALTEAQKAHAIEDIQKIRETIIKDAEEMVHGNQMLTETLDGAYSYLKALQKDGQRMSDELARVHMLSLTDELTGLPNRRAFLRHLDDEISRSKRYAFPLTIAIVDLDHFKSVNDRFGHSVGDAVLRNYAKDIFAILRHHDIVARFGGEEFSLMLPNTELHNGMAALNKVLMRARKSRFLYNDTYYEVPTMSVGITEYQAGETVTALLERADNALYKAKEQGRDQIASDPETKQHLTHINRQLAEENDKDELITWTPAEYQTASDR